MKDEIKIISVTRNKDSGNQLEVQKQRTLEELLKLPHPLEQHSELLELVTKYFPGKGYEQLLADAIKPGISDDPDELERWEAQAILERKQKMPNDFGIAYLIRLLYEETFSIQQFQDSKFGSEGKTIGGLLSHHLFKIITNGISISTITDLELKEKTYEKEFVRLVSEAKWADMEKFSIIITQLAFPTNYFISERANQIRRHLLRTRLPYASENMELDGYRMMKVIKLYPQLLEKNGDPKLLDILRISYPENLLMLLNKLWGILGRVPGVFFEEKSFYKITVTEDLLEGLEKLIQFRIHPDTQILYQFLSPSGYINDGK